MAVQTQDVVVCCVWQLIGGLADEKVRWRETVQQLEYMVNNVAGDVLLAAGYVAYLGPFTVSAWECGRENAYWVELCLNIWLS